MGHMFKDRTYAVGPMIWVFLISAASLAYVTKVQAADETNREIARTLANFHLGRKEFAPVIKILADHTTDDPNDFEALNLLALTQMESRDLKGAISNFQKAIQVATASERPLYHYNLADAYARLGDLTSARAALIRASESPLIKEPAEFAMSELKAGQPLPLFRLEKPMEWHFNIGIEGGYDSNVLLVSDDNQSSSDAKHTASPSGAPKAAINFIKDTGHYLWRGGLESGFTSYIEKTAQKYNELATRANIERGRPEIIGEKFYPSIANEAELTYLNTEGLVFYSWSDSLKWKGLFKHSEKHETELTLPAGYQKYTVADTDSPSNNRSGARVFPSLTYRRFFGTKTLALSASYQKVFASGINYRSSSYSIPISFAEGRMFWGLGAALSAEYTRTLYPVSETDRKDHTFGGSVALLRRLGPKWELSLTYNYRRNLSTDTGNRYVKHTGTLGLNYAAF